MNGDGQVVPEEGEISPPGESYSHAERRQDARPVRDWDRGKDHGDWDRSRERDREHDRLRRSRYACIFLLPIY